MRDLLTLIEGAQWGKHHVIPAGTMLFHGTDDDDFHPSEISGPAWFSTDNDVAEKFAGGRLLAYRLKADLKLPLITSASEMDDFAEKFNIDRMSSEDVRDSAKKAGIPGWIIPDNYEPGDDILICDLSVLDPVTSDLGDLQESERIDEMVNHDQLEFYHWTDAESLRQIMRSGVLHGNTEHTINGQKVAGVSMARNPFFDISSTYAISGIKAWRIGFNFQKLRYDHKIQPVRDDYLHGVPRQQSIKAHALINKMVSSDETEEFVTGDIFPIWNYVTSIAIEDRHIDVDYHPRETAEWDYEEFDNGVGGMSQEDQELLFDILAGTYFGADGMHRAFQDERPLAIKIPVPLKIIDRDTHRILDAKAVFQERLARSIYNDQHVPEEPEGKTPWPVSAMSPSRNQRNQMFDNKTRSVKVAESFQAINTIRGKDHVVGVADTFDEAYEMALEAGRKSKQRVSHINVKEVTEDAPEPEAEHPVFGNWPKVLRDNREIASYVSELDPRVDEEMIEEHYFGCHAVLKLIPIESVKEGPPDSNIRSASKEKKFAKMDLAKQPPILVEDGMVRDGNHRYRVAKAAGATDILAYVISYDEPITEGAATENYLYHGTSRRALGSIRIHGLTPKESKRSRFGASYKMNSDGRIFFTDDLNKAEWYAKDLAPSNPAILRVKKSAIRDAREDTLDTRSFYITHRVPPQEIEVLGARGWVRIAKPVELDERQTLPLKKGANDGARGLYGAFVCVMQPSDFLRLTTDGDEHLAKIHKDEFTDLQTYAADTDEKYGKSKYNMPFLFIEFETGRVTGHEGRHRAAMVERAGGRSFPCMIVFKESEKWRLTYEKASRTGHVDDELVQEFFPSEAKVDQRVDTLRSLNSLDQFDFYYEEFKVEQVTGKGTMKGSPRSDGWDYDSWKTQDIPEKFIGQFDPMVVIPTLRMKFGPVKGYRHFKS